MDFLIYEDNKLYPIEVKKNSNPGKADARHFKTLVKAFPSVDVAEGGVICTGSELLPIDKGVTSIPALYI